jgi:DNA-binding NarL/FixJ family response regulator
MKLRILIADDHPILRAGAMAILKAKFPDSEFLEAGTGAEAIRKTRDLGPDIVLMDYEMPVMDGLEAAISICANYPEVRVVMVSSLMDPPAILRAQKAGVRGFLAKENNDVELNMAVEQVMNGEIYWSPLMIRAAVAPRAGTKSSKNSFKIFTRRERDVVTLMTEGKQISEIAEILNISPKTVESHRTRIYVKSGTRNALELMRFAIA